MHHPEWLARSCDLTQGDFFLWGYVKSKDYENKPRDIPHLKDEIQREIHKIKPAVCGLIIVM